MLPAVAPEGKKDKLGSVTPEIKSVNPTAQAGASTAQATPSVAQMGVFSVGQPVVSPVDPVSGVNRANRPTYQI